MHIVLASTFLQRFLGLMGRAGLAPNEGLFLRDCRSVHTCFMRFPIDVVYLDGQGVVLKVEAAMAPWRASWGVRGGRHTLELAAGSAQRLGLRAQTALANHPQFQHFMQQWQPA